KDHGVGDGKVGMVERVEYFNAELRFRFFEILEILEERKVHRRDSRPRQCIPSNVAESSLCGERKALRLDVIIGVAGIGLGFAAGPSDQIWSLAECKSSRI